jgi:aryl-alcohol dehydrogenase-like predicted oxidoreductase
LQEINEADGIASVHEAFKLGINFFDSSPFYGGTKSETVRNCCVAASAVKLQVLGKRTGSRGQQENNASRLSQQQQQQGSLDAGLCNNLLSRCFR